MNCAIILFGFLFISTICTTNAQHLKKPKTILTVLLIRNKQHTLPYFLSHFSKLNYPKNRIALFIRSDHNHDRSIEVVKKWLSIYENHYHSIDLILNENSPSYLYETSSGNWTDERFDHIISLKEEAILKARKMWADYIWYLDADVFIIEPNILWNLIEKEKPIIAPMLKSLHTYSNYWCGMTENYWYERTEDYLPILNRKKTGCFSVPMVHSCVLIDLSLHTSDFLTFETDNIPGYDGPKDDIIAFAIGAKTFKTEMYICNDQKYGFIPPPLNENDKITKDYQQLIDIKLESLVEYPDTFPLSSLPELTQYAIPLPHKSKLNFDNIYLINLVRRSDRKERMLKSFDELGIDAEIFDAVDGTRLNASHLDALEIKQLSSYKDPWSKRDMTYGEIGCFLSHYYIWEDVVKNKYETVRSYYLLWFLG